GHGLDRFEGALLFRPVGYANGFGAIAAIGLVVAVGLSAASEDVRIRAALTAATAPLAGALIRTESRGALIAAAAGLVGGVAAIVVTAVVAVGVITGTTLGDRPTYWRAAIASFAHAPVGGTGAGTFALDWLRHRRISVGARDAHSLEVETLAELGPIGVAAVLAMVTLPFVAIRRHRGDPLVSVAAAGYAVLVVHSALDWDWEQPAVWLAGLAAA